MTLREILAELLTARLAALIGGAILVCVIAGPFQTMASPLLVRAGYWTVTILTATVMSMVLITYAFAGPLAPNVPKLVRGFIGAALFSLLYAGVLIVLSGWFFPNNGAMPGYPQFLGYVAPIAFGITLIVYLFQGRDDESAPAAKEAEPAAPRILSRIKPGLGARLMRLTMQDHYVEVFTDQGSQLVLMRFADALEEIAPTPGWRIHRSHWVAEAAMADIRRADGKTFVVLESGDELPISRTYLPKLREAGVLKRFG
ncbi:MAG: LytTR family DNA-binding domain-containing protein [Pikeienuella sp.]